MNSISNNKYSVFFSLYDNYKLSESNLYYYKGILYKLCNTNRDYDIYIDITKYCYDILIEIIKQEKLDIKNVYFNIHNDEDNDSGMLWRFNTLIKNFQKYECVSICDSDLIRSEDFHRFENIRTGLIVNQYEINKQLVAYWGSIQHIPGGGTYFKSKYILSNIDKIIYILDNILKYKYILKKYEFDEFLLTNIFYYDILKNNLCYVLNSNNYNKNHITEYSNFKIVTKTDDYKYNKLLYLKDNNYYLNEKLLIFNDDKSFFNIKNQNKNKSDNNIILNTTINKHMFLQIRRYMLNYINELDLENYNKKYE